MKTPDSAPKAIGALDEEVELVLGGASCRISREKLGAGNASILDATALVSFDTRVPPK